MPTAATQGNGIAFTTVTTGFAGEIVDISKAGHTRGPVDTSHAGTTPTDATTFTSYRTFIPSKWVDGGTYSITCHLDQALPSMTSALETLRLTYPKLAGQTVAAKVEISGFMTTEGAQYQPLADETMRQTFEFKVSGAPAYTVGS